MVKLFVTLAWQVGFSLAESPELRFESSTGCGKNCEFCDMTADICSQCGLVLCSTM